MTIKEVFFNVPPPKSHSESLDIELMVQQRALHVWGRRNLFAIRFERQGVVEQLKDFQKPEAGPVAVWDSPSFPEATC